MFKIFLALFTAISLPLFADQCAWNSRDISSRGAKLIKALASLNNERPSVYTLCEPCGETELKRVYLNKDSSNASGLDVTYTYASLTPGGEKDKTYWEVVLNSKSQNPIKVDLAYFYVKTSPEVYANLAALVNCPVEGVTPLIYPQLAK